MNKPRLLFVYNADSGLFNTLSDIGHKLFSPETYNCNLCAISHGYLSEKKEWRQFIESLGISCEFLHRDEFRKSYRDIDEPLPAVFLLDAETAQLCLDADTINSCHSMIELQQKILNHCIK